MVRTADGAFEMHVMLGDTKAEEFAPVPGCPPCDGFIEANLFVKGVSYQKETVETDPFGEEFTQAWPVTPYQVRVTNHTNELRWIRLYVDGEEAYGTNLLVDTPRILEGKQSKPGRGASAVHELLFARPRLVRRDESVDGPIDPSKLNELESIRVDIYDCTKGETRTSKRGASGGFDGVNKAVCKKAKAGAMTRTGDELKPADEGKLRTSYNIGAKISTLRIRYAQRDKLEKLGVVKDEPDE
jgi:hypothetical protein